MVVFKTVLTVLLVFIFTTVVNAFDRIAGVVHFDQTLYKGARQNWGVSVSEKGTLYFANHTGLLVFDGTRWTLNNLPNRTIVRSVKVHNDSVIYTGGYKELGYWKPNDKGELNYYSLNSKVKTILEDTPNMEFWNIALKKEYVYYQSFNRILAFHNDSVFPLKLDGEISVMSKIKEKVFVAVRDNGIWEIENDNVKLIINREILDKTTIKFLIPFKDNQILIGTAEKGIFLWDGEKLSIWNNKWTKYFVDNELNRGYYTTDDRIIIGTLVDGVVVFDTDGNVLMKVNTQNGLPNNTVLGIVTDKWQNIWLALDIGIGFISGNQNRGYAIQELPGIGAIYASAIFEEKLYLGTNQGLFVKNPDFNDQNISIVPKTQDQIWNLKNIGNELLVGHNQGSFAIKNGKAKQISDEAGAFNFIEDPFNSDLILQSTYNSLVVYRKTNDGVVFRNHINGFADLIRYIEVDHTGNIWAGHMHRGIYKIKVDEARENVLITTYYGTKVFGNEYSIHVFKVENRIVFTSGEKLYTFDDLKDTIVPYNSLNQKLGKYAAAQRIVEAPNHHYWFIGKDYIGLFSILQDDVKLLKEYPTSIFNNSLLVEGFENLTPIDEYSAILFLQNGIALLDASVTNPTTRLIQQFTPVIRRIELSDTRQGKTILPLKTKNIKINHNLNTATFKFSFPFMSEIPVSYRYILEGLETKWSEPVQNPEFHFDRLPAGKYVLKVKAVDLWGNESKEYSFTLEILPPLTTSIWAILFYILILISALLMFRSWGIRQTRKKEQIQHEVREKELIRLRNEKLRDEVRFKSKDLANLTLAIIRKNEFLIELKNIIQKHKNELGSRYPDKYFNYLNSKIDENISSRDDWQIFENNFERAHEQFFKKMKDKYSELTSSDLQLCAYLRMNLSSKEIAPLLGISVRGVENHRYRLRKKMGLVHNDSLTDEIHSI